MTLTESAGEVDGLATTMLDIHRAMREDGRRLIRAIERLPQGDAGRSAALGRAFAAVARLMSDHHDAEDELLWPVLLAYVPGFTPAVAAFEGDHAALDV